MIELVAIDNPRTPEGGWENELGCAICGNVSSAYVALRLNLLGEEIFTIEMCGNCISKAEKKRNELILKQCEKRVE